MLVTVPALDSESEPESESGYKVFGNGSCLSVFPGARHLTWALIRHGRREPEGLPGGASATVPVRARRPGASDQLRSVMGLGPADAFTAVTVLRLKSAPAGR